MEFPSPQLPAGVLQLVGWLIAAATALAALAVIWKSVRRAGNFGIVVAEGLIAIKELSPVIIEIATTFKNNGGSSLKDSIDSLTSATSNAAAVASIAQANANIAQVSAVAAQEAVVEAQRSAALMAGHMTKLAKDVAAQRSALEGHVAEMREAHSAEVARIAEMEKSAALIGDVLEKSTANNEILVGHFKTPSEAKEMDSIGAPAEK